MDDIKFLKHQRENQALRHPLDRIYDHKEHDLKSDKEDLIQRQSSRCMDCGVPFCISGCPLGNKIPNFNHLSYEKNWDKAIETLYSTNNFPEFTGRVCPAPCESSCVLGLIKEPVSIKQIEKHIAEKSFTDYKSDSLKPHLRTGKSIAIIGAGPAGLACAQQLNRAGHWVHVIEKASLGGGLLTYGIPEYKLPKSIVMRRIRQMEEEGIKFQFDCEVGKDISLKSLKKINDAVVLCLGAEKARDLKIEGRYGKGIYFAMDFLSQQACSLRGEPHWIKDKISAKDKNVIVIGGGDTGSDCIGTAIRQGAKRVINFEIMPKPPSKRAEDNPWPQFKNTYKESSSMEENYLLGGKTEYNMNTKGFLLDDKGQICAVETTNVEWVKKDEKLIYKEIPGSQKIWPCDLLLLALGYTNPLSEKLLENTCISHTKRGLIKTEKKSKMTHEDGIFTAGDCRRGQSLLVWAIAEGRDVASEIDSWLMKKQSLLPRVNTEGYDY